MPASPFYPPEHFGQWAEPERCTTTSAGGEVRCPNTAGPTGLCVECQTVADQRTIAAAESARVLRAALHAADPELYWEGPGRVE